MPFRYQRGGNYSRPSLFGGFSFFPPVIKTLLLSNVIVWLLMVLFSRYEINGIPMASVIDRVFALNPFGPNFRPWQLFSYMFMHYQFLHIFFNMLALWMFGMELENTWGSRRFLTYYLVCGVGAGVANLIFAPLFTVAAPTIGASGAVYGILIAFGMLFPDRPIFMFPIFIPIRAKFFVAIYIGIEIFLVTSSGPDNVAHFAHLGGAAVGYVMILIDRRRFPLQKFFDRMLHRPKMKMYNNTYDETRGQAVTDAKYYDIDEHTDDQSKNDTPFNQERIDQILDKISKGGYQNLTEEEKKILFDASKKLN